MSTDVYRNIASWKKPYHVVRAQTAKWWASVNPQVEIIGITGSVGKTTTKEAIISILSQKFATIGSVGNLDPVFNIPITLLKIRPWTKKVVLEMGIEYPGEMDFYLTLAKPKIGVLTQIYWTHTQFLGNLEGVINEKGKLLEALPKEGYAILNHDDEYIRERMAKKTAAKLFWFGSHPHKTDLYIADFLHQELTGSSFKLKYNQKEITINWKLVGEHNTVCAAAAASVGLISGLTLGEIKNGLEKLSPQPHRLNILPGEKGSFILDDSYNSSPLAAVMALETLRSLAQKGKAIAVLGDMLELGIYQDQGHREVGAKVAQEQIDYLITHGDRAKIIGDEAKKFGVKNILESNNITQIASEISKIVKKDDIILIKASRHAHFERIVFALTGQSSKINCPVCGHLS